MDPLQIGVCSWSLAIPDLAETLATVRDKLGFRLVQVGFFDDSYKEQDRVIETVRHSGLEVSATCVGFAGEDYSSIERIAATGGFVPDGSWPQRREKTLAVADITAALGVKLLAAHIGFVPHDMGSPQYATVVERIRGLCDELDRRGVTLVMETGQEDAESLWKFIAAVGRENIGINFDPANMILYGIGEPVDAIAVLAPRIVHVHMKDATWSRNPKKDWGTEVVLGTGEADIPRVVSRLRAGGYNGPLVIEREAGNQRLADIAEGKALLESLLG